MWRSKKFIVIALLAVVVLTGSIGGVALAQTEDENSNPVVSEGVALWDKVSAIYEQKTGVALDQEALKEAITEAQDELRTEAMQNHLQSLVGEGKISQEQADEYQKWLESKPEVPIEFGFRGKGDGFHGWGGMHGWGGPCVPSNN